MRRWVVAFLLFVVPFQLVWAAAVPYCAHEADASAKKHFGHHEHQHLSGGQIVAATEDASDATGAFHADCPTCHLGCSAFMVAATPDVEALPRGAFMRHSEPRYDSYISAGPQRPDRVRPTPAARFGGGVVMVSLAD